MILSSKNDLESGASSQARPCHVMIFVGIVVVNDDAEQRTDHRPVRLLSLKRQRVILC
jgi:hypothetical protein